MDRSFRFYTAGPMTGLPGHNFKAFDRAKKKLEAQGIEVLSPSENFGGAVIESLRAQYMRRDIEQLLKADAVVVLDGWEKSNGALLEVAIAREIAIPVLKLEDLSEIRENVNLSARDTMATYADSVLHVQDLAVNDL